MWGFAPEPRLAGGADVPLRSGDVTVAVPGVRLSAAGGSSSNQAGAPAADAAQQPPPPPPISSSQNGDKIARIEARLEADVARAVQRVDGELWWVFQHVDTAVEASIDYIDGLMGEGRGHGHRVMKILLLGAPVFVAVVAGAAYVLSGGDFDFFFDGDEYRGHNSNSKRI